jgi:hypothetical protein
MIEPKKQTLSLWRRFLSSDEGSELLRYIGQYMPTVGRGDGQQIIFDAGKVEGYRECLTRFEKLLDQDKQKESEDNP